MLSSQKFTKEYHFKWIVHNLYGVGTQAVLMSPTFICKGKEFHLKFSVRLSIYTLYMEPWSNAPRVNVRVHVEDRAGRVLPHRYLSNSFYNYDDRSSSHSKDSIIWQSCETEIANSTSDFRGSLTFIVIFGKDVEMKPNLQKATSLPNVKIEQSSQNPAYKSSVTCLQSLSEDLSKMLDQGEQPDLVLTCGDLKMKVHKIILSSRSQVFAAMLNSDMAETNTGTVKIQDMDQTAFQHFVRYLYSGQLPDLTVDIARNLYEAADKYAVKVLMRRCARFLLQNLKDNSIEMLILADIHCDHDFKESVMDYILDQKIPLLRDEHWVAFCRNHPVMAVEVFDRFCKSQSSH